MRRARALPVAAWPATDRAAWAAARTPRAGLWGAGGSAAALRPDTVRLYETRYGAWLAFLDGMGWLDAGEAPAARVTPVRIDAFAAALIEAGRANSTITTALAAVHALLRHIAPGAELDFIVRPDGRPLRELLPPARKPPPEVDTEDVVVRLRVLHAASLAEVGTERGREGLRTAAVIAILVRRAPRIATLAAMTVGRHLRPRDDGTFAVSFPPEHMKADDALCWDLDPDCSAILGDYLRLAWPHWAAAGTETLWPGRDGAPLGRAALTRLVRRIHREWFGQPWGPHVYRKWLRGSAERRSAQAAMDAAAVMGHTVQTSLRHYAKAEEVGAAMRHGTRLRVLRQGTAALARRALTRNGAEPMGGKP